MLMKKKLKLKNKLIPVNHPIITSSDIDSVKKCLHSNWISGDSPVVKKFEKEFKELFAELKEKAKEYTQRMKLENPEKVKEWSHNAYLNQKAKKAQQVSQ